MKCLLLTLLLSASLMGYAQKEFSVTIVVPPDVQKERIYVSYDDGKGIKSIKFDPGNDSLTISGQYYSLYCPVEIGYSGTAQGAYSYYGLFYVKQKPARISFRDRDASIGSLGKVTIQNADDAHNLGVSQSQAYIEKEYNDFKDFYEANKMKISSSDSLIRLADAKSRACRMKILEFIEKNSSFYYSFWQFRVGYAAAELISADSLIHIFQRSFPAKYKNSFEGKEILNILTSRLMLEKNKTAPDFNATDINGNKVTLSHFRGKYVLIAFWALWCVPCIKELSVLTKKTEHLPKDKLQIIYITEDTDSAKFLAAKKKYHLDGTHIFGTQNIISSYNAAAIPQLYLVDQDGNLIYERYEAGEDDQLSIITELLKKCTAPTP